MLNINFVPDDYIQSNESHRTNLMYLILFAVVMAALGGVFATIKIRQRGCDAAEKLVNKKMAQAKESLKQFEELQEKRKEMMRTALTTAELIEPVSRSVLLASLTNNLPMGMSLLELNFAQKESKQRRRPAATSKYQAAQAKTEEAFETRVSPEKLLETHIAIEGIAPSDLQVAAYIERLGNSTLLDNVALVESKEHKIKKGPAADTPFRQFKLTAMLTKNVHLTKEDIERIKDKCEKTVRSF